MRLARVSGPRIQPTRVWLVRHNRRFVSVRVQEDGKWLVLPEWRYDRVGQLNNKIRTTSRASIVTLCYYFGIVISTTGSVKWLDGGLYWLNKPLQAFGLGEARVQRRSTM